MGNIGSHPTPEDIARRKPISDFAKDKSLTPLDPQVKKRLPGFVPILCVPEGSVHRVQLKEKEGQFGNSVTPSPNDTRDGYVFQPNRTADHISGAETKVRYIRHFGSEARRGKVYFLRTRAVERKSDMTERQKFLTQLLDQVKSQNGAFKALELEQMRKIENALEEIVNAVERSDTGDLREGIKNAVKGDDANLVSTIVSDWLNLVNQKMDPSQQTKWGKLKTNVLRSKPWLKAKAETQAEILKRSMDAVPTLDSGTLESTLSNLSEFANLPDLSAEERRDLMTPDTDGTHDADDTLNDSIASALPVEEVLALDRTLLEDFLADAQAAEPDFNPDDACDSLALVLDAYSDFITTLYEKYAVADDQAPTGSSVSVVQFQIFVLEANCAIEEREAKDLYDSLCGFDWDKEPKKIMQLNLFAHALIRTASQYIENVMSQSDNPDFTEFDGKQLGSHVVELLRHCNHELEIDADLPDVSGVADIRIKKITSTVAGVDLSADADTGGAASVTAAEADDPDVHWKLNSTFQVDSVLLEDLCEEIEEPEELQALLGELLKKVKELERLIIGQFADAIGVEEVNTLELDQFLPREDFLEHAAGIDSIIDADTSDDVFSQLCGYPFEKVQKKMDLHIYVHAWVRLANLYSMFAAEDGTADFVDIVSQLDFLAEKLRSKGLGGAGKADAD